MKFIAEHGEQNIVDLSFHLETGAGKTKVPSRRERTRYNIISFSTYFFFAFLAAFFLGAAFFLAAFFFVAMFLEFKMVSKKTYRQ